MTFLAILPWILVVILLFFWIGGQQLTQRHLLNVRAYVVYLLLDDDIRKSHQVSFIKWIQESPINTAPALTSSAYRVIESMSKDLADGNPGSILGAHAMIWNVRQNSRTE